VSEGLQLQIFERFGQEPSRETQQSTRMHRDGLWRIADRESCQKFWRGYGCDWCGAAEGSELGFDWCGAAEGSELGLGLELEWVLPFSVVLKGPGVSVQLVARRRAVLMESPSDGALGCFPSRRHPCSLKGANPCSLEGANPCSLEGDMVADNLLDVEMGVGDWKGGGDCGNGG
jgi:hypothetical protein